MTRFGSLAVVALLAALLATPGAQPLPAAATGRVRVSINDGWRFTKGDPPGHTGSLLYDVRPEIADARDDRPADAEPQRAAEVRAQTATIKAWILPTGNPFIAQPAARHARPAGTLDGGVYAARDFDDRSWRQVDLPHDWGIEGPFLTTGPHGGMGRLPSWGVAWYRKTLDIPAADAGRSIFLDVDGAMSYATVWLNGRLVGGWPFGYASWRVDLTPHVVPGGRNQLAIRLDNPPSSSRWYPGGGLYRNVWLTKTSRLHVGHWGALVRTRNVSASSATVDVDVTIDNDSNSSDTASVRTHIYALDHDGARAATAVAAVAPADVTVAARSSASAGGSVTLDKPALWGPPPTQQPHLYVAVTTVSQGGRVVDSYETRFGIRDLRFDPNRGVFVNGERIVIKGANQHHDLGALGAAFNLRAAERQLEMLVEMGANAVRMAHNPPAPELLDLTDRMGILVVNELFDVWERRKTPLDFHLIFRDWHEPDTRAWVRRDRNHPSVIMWSTGNEVGEQYTAEEGAALAARLRAIVKEEDPTRPTTASMNYAKPDMPFASSLDVISLNYQGEGIRDAAEYADLQGIRTSPLYPAFHDAFPDKLIVSTENAAAVSSRGEYLFPVTTAISAPVRDGRGGEPGTKHVSAYELYTAPFGASPDKVFGSLDAHPYVAGGFVWSGWDYLGEPTPYYSARSSYFGAIDLAGFKKDRFFLYQAHWRPELSMAHILPHWTWPERRGQVTPVHVFTSGDEGELFLNGRSLGRRRKGPSEYRLRWDDVVYEPGSLEVIVYKNGARWAGDAVRTAGSPAALEIRADRATIAADGSDLSFVTVRVLDSAGVPAPRANNRIRFTIDGPGEIVATDNGDPTSFTPFHAHEREAFNGLALAIVKARKGATGRISVTASSDGLKGGSHGDSNGREGTMNRSERRLGGWRQFAVVTALVAVASPPTISDAGRQAATDRITLAVDASKTGAKIDRNIFGQFAEHLGRGIYEGVWVGPDSPIPNTRGIRNDVVAALKALKVPNVRWPGGCFADEYHWRKGIGRPGDRAVTLNSNWGGVTEPNTFGTHEFMDFLGQIGAEAFLSVNVGSGTPQEAADWLEYLTTAQPTTLAKERAANGHAAPYKIAYLGIGNESWDCGGNMTPEYYLSQLKIYSRFVRNFNPAQQPDAQKMRKVAVGPGGGGPRWTEWTDTIMKAWKARQWSWDMDGLSLHHYTVVRWPPAMASVEFGETEYAQILNSTLEMNTLIATHAAIMDKYDPEKKIALVVDEWGAWYAALPGSTPGFLAQQNSLRDAILAALNLNIFSRHAERVRGANIAQMINVLQAMIVTDKEKMMLTPTYHVFRMYVPFQDATVVPVTFDAGRYTHRDLTLPRVDAIAAKDGAGTLWMALTNIDPVRPIEISARVSGTAVRTATGEVLTAAAVDSVNTFDAPRTVTPQAVSARVQGDQISVALPPKSVTVLAVR